jgi:hypothetical protein
MEAEKGTGRKCRLRRTTTNTARVEEEAIALPSSLKLGKQAPNETSTAKTIMLTNSGTAAPRDNVSPSATKSARVRGLSFATLKIVAR